MGQKRNFSGRNSAHQVSALDGAKSSKVPSTGRYNKTTLKTVKKEVVVENHSVQNLNKERILHCLYCGKPLQSNRYKLKNQVCNQECRKAYTQKTIEEENRIADILKTRQRRHSRKCRICGKDCFPNYFFCNTHLPKTSIPFDYD